MQYKIIDKIRGIIVEIGTTKRHSNIKNVAKAKSYVANRAYRIARSFKDDCEFYDIPYHLQIVDMSNNKIVKEMQG